MLTTMVLFYADLALSLDLPEAEITDTINVLFIEKKTAVLEVDNKVYFLSPEGLRYAVLEEKKEITP